LFNEIKYMAQLKSPFIVPMLGVQQDAKFIYIIMEYAA
jgi:serine/threonine protein kinase